MMDPRKLRGLTFIMFPLVLVIAFAVVSTIYSKHTFTLSGSDTLKSEQIQPIKAIVEVTGTMDTDVVFTDVETGQTYTIGYITPGMGGKIELETGKWYTVEALGNITVRPVNVRVE